MRTVRETKDGWVYLPYSQLPKNPERAVVEFDALGILRVVSKIGPYMDHCEDSNIDELEILLEPLLNASICKLGREVRLPYVAVFEGSVSSDVIDGYALSGEFRLATPYEKAQVCAPEGLFNELVWFETGWATRPGTVC